MEDVDDVGADVDVDSSSSTGGSSPPTRFSSPEQRSVRFRVVNAAPPHESGGKEEEEERLRRAVIAEQFGVGGTSVTTDGDENREDLDEKREGGGTCLLPLWARHSFAAPGEEQPDDDDDDDDDEEEEEEEEGKGQQEEATNGRWRPPDSSLLDTMFSLEEEEEGEEEEGQQEAGGGRWRPPDTSLLDTMFSLRAAKMDANRSIKQVGVVNSFVLLTLELVATGGSDRKIRIYNTNSWKCERVLRGHRDWVLSLARGTGPTIISGARDFTIRVWSIPQSFFAAMEKAAPTARGRASVGGGRSRNRRTPPAPTPPQKQSEQGDEEDIKCTHVLTGHTGDVNSVRILPRKISRSVSALGDGQNLMISGSEDKTIRIWQQGGDWPCLRVLESTAGMIGIHDILVLKRRRCMITAHRDHFVRVWDLEKFCIDHQHTLIGHRGSVWCLETFEDVVISGGVDGKIKIWDSTSWTFVMDCLNGHTDGVWALLISAEKLVSGSSDHTVRIWCAHSWSCERVFAVHEAKVCSLALVGSKYAGPQLVSASADWTMVVWRG